MKVRDLIKSLIMCDWDADVVTSTSEDICIGYSEDGKFIFIDSSDICPTCKFYDTSFCTNNGDILGCANYEEG